MTVRNRTQYPNQTRQEFEYLSRQIQATKNPLGLVPVGARLLFDSELVPDYWMAADGRELSREKYAALFKATGTTNGAGNGTTTFNLVNASGYIVYVGVL